MSKHPNQFFCFAIIALSSFIASLHATPLTWDADPTNAGLQDGTGFWDTTANAWWDGTANVTWNNASPDSATFGNGNGTAGVVTNLVALTVGNITFNAAGSGSYTLTNTAANPLTFSATTITNNVNAAINAVLAGTGFTKEGSGQLSLRPPANNAYTGTTIVNNGILALNSGSAGRILISGDLIINSGATVTNTGTTDPVADAASVTVNTGGTYADGGDTIGTLVLAGGTVVQVGTKLLVATVDARSGSIIEASGATGKLDGNLTKSTGGTVTLFSRGSANAAGLTNVVVNAGRLVLDYTQTTGKINDTASTLTVNGGTLIFTNYNNSETITALILAGGIITNAAGTADLRVPSGNIFDVRSGAVYLNLGGGTGRMLAKTTPGTVVLAADNTYSGGTLISGGILQIGDGGLTGLPGSVSAPITNNATLVINRSGAPTNLSGTISGTGSIIKMGGGTIGLTDGNNSYSGSTTISNGVINIGGSSKLGDGTGALILSGGTLNTTATRTASSAPIANPLLVTADSAITTTNPAATVDLNFTNDAISGTAGTLTFRNDAASGTGVFNPRFSGSGFNFSRPLVITNGSFGTTRLDSYNTTGTTQTFSGAISGDGSYRRNATASGNGGTTIFSGNNTYTGPTDLNRGLLVVNGTLGTNLVTVGSTATLGGNGTLNGPVLIQTSGTLSAGTSIGRLTISNTLTFQNTCTNISELDKSAGTNDLVRGISTLAYAGTLVVINLSGTLAADDTFKLFDAASYTGSFADFDLPPLAGGLNWDTADLTNNGTIKITGTALNSPQIGAVALSGTDLILTGTGGTEGADYSVLTSTNVAAPLAGWKPIATNQFITGGNFNFTNAIDPLKPSLFYILRVP